MRGYMQDTLDGLNPLGQFEKAGKQNMAVIENAMKMFAPFYPGCADPTGKRTQAEKAVRDHGEEFEDLRLKPAEMQNQRDKLGRSKDES